VSKLDLWLKIFDICDVGEVCITSEFGWKESFDPAVRNCLQMKILCFDGGIEKEILVLERSSIDSGDDDVGT
jgi:hypothetical protein